MILIINKSDTIHKSEAQEIGWQTNIDNYRVAKNCSDIDYRVASLPTRYQTAKGISSENLKSIGQY